MIRCLITDGNFAKDPTVWLSWVAQWLERGVDIVQIRERDLSARELAVAARKVLGLPRPHHTKILVNDRADVALACGADGVHLRDHSLSPAHFARPGFMVTVACHTAPESEDVHGADYTIMAPIFKPLSKDDSGIALGLDALRQAARTSSVPILALGGITPANARLCVEAGAAGIAGISYFRLNQ